MKNPFFVLTFVVASSCVGYSAVYSTNFDNNSLFPSGGNLAGNDGWQIQGADIVTSPLASRVVGSPFAVQSSGVRAGSLGWQEINGDATSVYLYHALNSPLVGNTASYSQFRSAVTIQDSSLPYNMRDVFGFTFRDDSNAEIFSIKFTPTGPAADPDASTRVDNVSWSSAYGAGDSLIGTLTEGQATTINLTFAQIGLSNDVLFTLKSGPADTLLATGTLAGAASANIKDFGVTWNPADPDNVGSNLIIFDDISLVPEPSSAMLGLLGVSLVFIRRRR